MEEIKVGDLIRFDLGYSGYDSRLDKRIGLYLGEDLIHRNDGVVIENHKVLMNGEHTPRILDRGLLRCMKKYDKNA